MRTWSRPAARCTGCATAHAGAVPMPAPAAPRGSARPASGGTRRAPSASTPASSQSRQSSAAARCVVLPRPASQRSDGHGGQRARGARLGDRLVQPRQRDPHRRTRAHGARPARRPARARGGRDAVCSCDEISSRCTRRREPRARLRPGQLRVGEQTHTSSVIVTATTLIDPLASRLGARHHARRTSSRCSASARRSCCSAPARVSNFPTPRSCGILYEQRIGVEVMDTSAACRTFNVLVAEGRCRGRRADRLTASALRRGPAAAARTSPARALPSRRARRGA